MVLTHLGRECKHRVYTSVNQGHQQLQEAKDRYIKSSVAYVGRSYEMEIWDHVEKELGGRSGAAGQEVSTSRQKRDAQGSDVLLGHIVPWV